MRDAMDMDADANAMALLLCWVVPALSVRPDCQQKTNFLSAVLRFHDVASESNSLCPSTITTQRSIARNLYVVGWHVYHESVRRIVGMTYSRVVLEALSTHLGFFCRIDTTSHVVICTTEGGRAANIC